MKKCFTCGVEKELTEFNKNKAKKSGLQAKCRGCQREYDRSYYSSRELRRQSIRSGDKKRQLVMEEFVAGYLAEHPCVDCGESDILVLEFDHLYDKKFNLGDRRTFQLSYETVTTEISKCEVRCANCHRRRTAKQFGSWKYKRQTRPE